VTDIVGNENGTNTYTNFGVLPDNIMVEHIAGDWSIANRSRSQTDNLTLRFLDTDNNTYLPQDINITLRITHNYFVYNDYLLQTNDSGYTNYEFDPGCSGPQYDVGPQFWYAKVNTSETCYYSNESDIFDLTVMGEFNITVFKPDGSSNYTWGDLIFMQGQVKDDCTNTIDAAQVSFNMSVNTYNYGFVPNNLGGGFYQEDWDSTNASEGYYNVTMMVNKTYYYENESLIQPPDSFYIYTEPILKEANATPRLDGWGKIYNFSVNVTDELGDNVTVKLETRKYGVVYSQVGDTQNCTSCTNYTMWWNQSYTCDSITGNPTHYFRFTGTDDRNNIHITSTTYGDYVDGDDTYVLEKDDVSILHISGHGNSVNRSSGSTTFMVFVNDTDRGVYVQDYTATVNLNVTTNTTNPGSVNITEDTNTTNSSGFTSFTFSPGGNCNYEVGNQTWQAYVASDTLSSDFNVTIMGDMNANVTADNYTHYQQEVVYFTINITDECGRLLKNVNITQAVVKNESTNFTCTNMTNFGNGTFQCEWNTTLSTPLAKYGVEITITTNGSYNNETEFHNDVVWLRSYINNAPTFTNPSHIAEGWGAQTNFTILVQDVDYNNVTVDFWTSPDGSAFTFKGTQNCTACFYDYMNFSL